MVTVGLRPPPPPPPEDFFHGIGHRRLREVQRIERRTGAVDGVQNGALIGEQCLVGRNILFALQILRAVGTGIGFGLGQLDGIGQLNRCKIGNIFVDGPDESIRSRIVQHLETAVIFTQIFGIISEIGHVAVCLGFQLRAADSQLQRAGNKIERIAHLVLHRGTGADGVEDVVLDLVEVNRLSTSQVAHEVRTPMIVVRAFLSNCVTVISLCLRFLINLIGQIQSLINGVRIILISIILGSPICCCFFPEGS